MVPTTPVLASAAAASLLAICTCLACVGVGRVRRGLRDADRRVAEVAPYLLVTALAAALRRGTHDARLEASRALDWDVTAVIYGIEGTFVAGVQTAVPDALVPVLSTVYVLGFPSLVLAAALVYFLSGALARLKELLVAYLVVGAVGTACYTLFVAYGPRIHLAGLVEQPMYDRYPIAQEVTATVSARTNVFPSLHAALAAVVLLLAWRTRGSHPRWFAIAAVGAAGVVVSTMALGIHWLVDVVAGVLLAVVAVGVATGTVRRLDGAEPAGPAGGGIARERGRSDPGD